MILLSLLLILQTCVILAYLPGKFRFFLNQMEEIHKLSGPRGMEGLETVPPSFTEQGHDIIVAVPHSTLLPHGNWCPTSPAAAAICLFEEPLGTMWTPDPETRREGARRQPGISPAGMHTPRVGTGWKGSRHLGTEQVSLHPPPILLYTLCR